MTARRELPLHTMLALLALLATPPCVVAQRCAYSSGGATVASRTNTIQRLEFGAVRFEQDCEQAEARGAGVIDLTSEGTTTLVAGAMAQIGVGVQSCTLAWPGRYAEVWLDWRGSGQFERLVDSVGGTWEPSMRDADGLPFVFRFRVPADARPGLTRLRVGAAECQSCFRGECERLDPCAETTDRTALDLAVLITAAPVVVAGAVNHSGAPELLLLEEERRAHGETRAALDRALSELSSRATLRAAVDGDGGRVAPQGLQPESCKSCARASGTCKPGSTTPGPAFCPGNCACRESHGGFDCEDCPAAPPPPTAELYHCISNKCVARNSSGISGKKCREVCGRGAA